MNMSVSSVIPWQEIKQWQDSGQNNFVVSTFIERLYGGAAANIATLMILWVALASLFAVMLGYSRVPYAAAVDGAFFKIFARVHPTKNFPYVSLLVLAAFALVFSLLFRIKHTIDGILAMRIMVQSIGQAVVICYVNEMAPDLPYKMPLYPLPVILAIIMWLFVFCYRFTTIVFFMVADGLIMYFILAKMQNQWPFKTNQNLRLLSSRK
jgi:amino acid transporter